MLYKNKKMNTLTIQINDLSALERLIGGDTQVELDIRQSVVESFTKKHLKSLVDANVMNRIQSAVVEETSAGLVEKIQASWSSNYKLTTTAQQLISNSVKDVVAQEVSQLVRDEIGRTNISATITDLLQKQSAFISNELSETVLSNKLDMLVNNKLKERLGLK